MARLGRFGFLGVAIVFHLIYACSIFDIYFVSPIVHGMTSYGVHRQANAEAPAKRLVLFVGDGLRADKAFQSFPDPSPNAGDSPDAKRPRPLTPFLRTKVEQSGTFGVSHTRVPTESRPGHVALIAGLYEDVSAVMTGWKLNPVNFDSVFNRSRHTWSWGSPDILPMFKEGAVQGRVDADCYGAEFEDFTKDATQLDTWVFGKVKELFASAAKNATLDQALRQDKNVFFLHLLGLDTTGHAYRPYSREYLYNIKIVDEGVKEITKLLDDFYNDGKTAYVFTADHGMNDMGSHGDGHPDNTRTPLIAWGAGVAGPVIHASGVAPGHDDGFSSDWGFDHISRNDVAQADIAALMAYLAGLDYPVNSVGEVPLAYIAGNAREKSEAMLANTQSILEMYRVKEQQKRQSEIRFKPYPPIRNGSGSAEKRIESIRSAIDAGEHDAAIDQSQTLLHIGLDGLRYLQTYDWLFLRMLITTGYLGWIIFALTTVIDMHVLHGEMQDSRTTSSMAVFVAAGVALFANLMLKRASIYYYAYSIFPLIFWEEIYARRQAFVLGSQYLLGDIKTNKGYTVLALQCLAYLAVLEALVLSYFLREVYTICFLMASFWPFMYGRDFVRKDKTLVATWVLACISMSTFTVLSPTLVEDINLICLGGLLMLTIGLAYLLFEGTILSTRSSIQSSEVVLGKVSKIVVGIQVGLIALAIIITRSSVASLQARNGLPLGNQVVGWAVLVASLLVPFFHGLQPNNHYLHRLVIIFLTFSPIFIILTISYEGLFYFVFCATLVTWVRLEHHVYVHSLTDSKTNKKSTTSEPVHDAFGSITAYPYRRLNLSDARISLFFLFLLQSAFFSTGNIASISTFSLDAVYRLIPVFSPFSQGVLLLFKILVPFAVISANLGILNKRLRVAPSSLFMVVMAISDVLTMNFFWMVRDEGSWLEIGTSISHFIIVSAFCIFVPGLEFISELFITGVEIGDNGAERTQGDDKSAVLSSNRTTSNGHHRVNGHAKKHSKIE